MDKLFYIMKGGLGHYMNGVPLLALLTKSRSWQIAILVTRDSPSSCADENGVCAIAACGTSVEGSCDEYGLLPLDIKIEKICKINIWKLWKICNLIEIKLWRLFYKWRRSLFPFHLFYPKPCKVQNFHDSILWREENPPGSRKLLHTPTCTYL